MPHNTLSRVHPYAAEPRRPAALAAVSTSKKERLSPSEEPAATYASSSSSVAYRSLSSRMSPRVSLSPTAPLQQLTPNSLGQRIGVLAMPTVADAYRCIEQLEARGDLWSAHIATQDALTRHPGVPYLWVHYLRQVPVRLPLLLTLCNDVRAGRLPPHPTLTWELLRSLCRVEAVQQAIELQGLVAQQGIVLRDNQLVALARHVAVDSDPESFRTLLAVWAQSGWPLNDDVTARIMRALCQNADVQPNAIAEFTLFLLESNLYLPWAHGRHLAHALRVQDITSPLAERLDTMLTQASAHNSLTRAAIVPGSSLESLMTPPAIGRDLTKVSAWESADDMDEVEDLI